MGSGEIMKKIFVTLAIIGTVLFTLTGCSTSLAYTFKVETGDKIKIELNTTGGYSMTSNLPFVISKDEESLSQGIFISSDQYDQYISSVNNDSNAKIIENTTKDGIEYTFYSYNNSEWNYIIKINNSNTGLLIGNPISQESAEECFGRLTITKES